MEKYTFDGENRLFLANPGVTGSDVQVDLYSDWKEELVNDTTNLKFLQAMRSVGGDPLSPERNLGDTYFMLNDYRIRPDESDHRLSIEGNLWVDPFGESPYVQTTGSFNVMVESTVSNLVDATISRLEIKNLQFLIESQRDTHSAYGDLFYWDPEGGSDASDGSTEDEAVKTFAAAHALAADGNHDVIIALATSAVPPTLVDDTIIVSKDYLFVRGPGRDLQIEPSTVGVEAAIITNCEGAEISGMILSAPMAGGVGLAVKKADFPLLESLWIEECDAEGVVISGSAYPQIRRCHIHENRGDGVLFVSDIEDGHIVGTHIEENQGHGVETRGANCYGIMLGGNHLHENQGFGIAVGSGSSHFQIKDSNNIFHNNLGAYRDWGTNTIIEMKFNTVQATQLEELHAIQGLLTGSPMEVSETERRALGMIVQSIEADTPVTGTVRVTRTG